MYEAEEMFRIIGKVVDDSQASGGQAVEGALLDEGFLNFGPYTSELVGGTTTNRAMFFIKLLEPTATDETLFTIDIAVDGVPVALRAVQEFEFKNTTEFIPFDLEFSSPQTGQIEYRLNSLGRAKIRLDRVEVRSN